MQCLRNILLQKGTQKDVALQGRPCQKEKPTVARPPQAVHCERSGVLAETACNSGRAEDAQERKRLLAKRVEAPNLREAWPRLTRQRAESLSLFSLWMTA